MGGLFHFKKNLYTGLVDKKNRPAKLIAKKKTFGRSLYTTPGGEAFSLYKAKAFG